MAKRSAIEKNNRRAELAKRYFAKRQTLKDLISTKDLPIEERLAAVRKLSEMPKNGAKIRVRNRCLVTGRPRAYYRKFGMSRISLRDLGSKGLIPGLTKSSW
jgi:small subunit ribosomal protein S14